MASSKKKPMEPPKVVGDLLSTLSKTPVSQDSTETIIPAQEPAAIVAPVVEKTVETPAPKAKTLLTEEQAKKTAVNLSIPAYIKNDWKSFFASHGLTMTDGLIAAVKYLEQQVDNGSVTIGAISVQKI